MAIGDYEKIGWTPNNPKPVSSYNLEIVDNKIFELDRHLLNLQLLSGAIQGPAGITNCDGGMANSNYLYDQILDCGDSKS